MPFFAFTIARLNSTMVFRNTHCASITTSPRGGLGNFVELTVEPNTDEITARPLVLQHLLEVSIIHVAVTFFLFGWECAI
jgi:hypothetical protein